MPNQHAQNILSNEDQNSSSLNFKYPDLSPHDPGLLSQIDEDPVNEETEEAARVAEEAAAKVARAEAVIAAALEEETQAQIEVKSNRIAAIVDTTPSPSAAFVFTKQSPVENKSPSNLATVHDYFPSPENNGEDSSATTCYGFFTKFLNRKREAVTPLVTNLAVGHSKIR